MLILLKDLFVAQLWIITVSRVYLVPGVLRDFVKSDSVGGDIGKHPLEEVLGLSG